MPQQFHGTITISEDSDSGDVTITLDGAEGSASIGGNTANGEVNILDGAGDTVVAIDAGDAAVTLGAEGQDGDIYVQDSDDNRTIHAGGEDARLRLGADGEDGDLFVQNDNDNETIHAEGNNARLRLGGEWDTEYSWTSGAAGTIILQNYGGDDVAKLDGLLAKLSLGIDDGIALYGHTADIRLGTDSADGRLSIRNDDDEETIQLEGSDAKLRLGETSEDGSIDLYDEDGEKTIHLEATNARLDLGESGDEGDIFMYNESGEETVHLEGKEASLRLGESGNSGDIYLHDKDDDESIHLDGDAGDILLKNADCAEQFAAAEENIEPGSVVVLDDGEHVRTSTEPYDTRVAGVVSGAGEYQPGMILDKETDEGERVPVALMGKVNCKVDASAGPIDIGDMLTTAGEPGHAMKAADPGRSFGAVLGKALQPLASGKELLPVLVTLK